MIDAPILITTAISPPPGVPYLQMTDAAQRLIATKAAIFMWASQGAKKLTVVDSTGQAPLNEVDFLELAAAGVDVEQLFFLQDQDDVIANGKGRSEGKIVEFALNNSRQIAEFGKFYKSTGKTYVRNYKYICQFVMENNIRNIFWENILSWASDMDNAYMGDPGHIDTRFYFCDVGFAREHLLPAYQGVNDLDGKITETQFFSICRDNLNYTRCRRPIVSGISGGTGKEYFDGSLGSLDYSSPAWVR